MASGPRLPFAKLAAGRILAFAYANAGLLLLTVSVAAAGALAFYFVTVPPGTVAYP